MKQERTLTFGKYKGQEIKYIILTRRAPPASRRRPAAAPVPPDRTSPAGRERFPSRSAPRTTKGRRPVRACSVRRHPDSFPFRRHGCPCAPAGVRGTAALRRRRPAARERIEGSVYAWRSFLGVRSSGSSASTEIVSSTGLVSSTK